MARPGKPTWVRKVVMNWIDPPLRMWGTKRRAVSAAPKRLTEYWVLKASAVLSSKDTTRAMPAFGTTISTPPWARTASSTRRFRSSGLVTSPATALTCPGWLASSAFRASRLRANAMTRAPSSTYLSTIDFPIPLLAPVTTATVPSGLFARSWSSRDPGVRGRASVFDTEAVVDDAHQEGAAPQAQGTSLRPPNRVSRASAMQRPAHQPVPRAVLAKN